MSEIVPIAASAIIGSTCGILGSYVILKRSTSTEALYGKLDELTEEIVKDTRMQQKIYAIGALLGQGIASGTGLKGMVGGSGKFKMQDIIMGIAGRFFGGGQNSQEQPQQGSEQIGLVKR